ncbi:MAG: type II toxin-antitoxin system HicB family antitoxin [candidate division Zixibacteria bacterium]|nr:type II toxin-antitoxin system HicB family antitoxin [candidate division Zixibacteria bacterium]
MEYTAVVKHTGEWWIGWIEEVPGVNCQERTYQDLRQSLVESLSEALDFNRRVALDTRGSES